MASFAPTLAYLTQRHPKWRWKEVQLHEFTATSIHKAFTDRGLLREGLRGPICLGHRGMAKRSKVKSYLVVDKWSRWGTYLCPSHHVDRTTHRAMWEPNDRDGFEQVLGLMTALHQNNRADILSHLDKKAEEARAEELLKLHERRHGTLPPLERLRMRWRAYGVG